MDGKILKRIDGICAETQTTRVDVLCVLVRALVGRHATRQAGQAGQEERGLPGRPVLRLSPQECIMRAMRSRPRCTVRELKQATSSRRISVCDWDNALMALCDAGELRVADERVPSGQIRRTVTLLTAEDKAQPGVG
jgi:hypothetical protein